METLTHGAIHLPSQLNRTVSFKSADKSEWRQGRGWARGDGCSWKWLPNGCKHKNLNLCFRYRETKLGCVVFHLRSGIALLSQNSTLKSTCGG